MTNGKKAVLYFVPSDRGPLIEKFLTEIGLECKFDEVSFLLPISVKKTIEIPSKENHAAADEFLRSIGYAVTETQDGRRYDFQHKESIRAKYSDIASISPNFVKHLNNGKK